MTVKSLLYPIKIANKIYDSEDIFINSARQTYDTMIHLTHQLHHGYTLFLHGINVDQGPIDTPQHESCLPCFNSLLYFSPNLTKAHNIKLTPPSPNICSDLSSIINDDKK